MARIDGGFSESDRTYRPSDEEQWVLDALRNSDQTRREDKRMDREVLENYMVLPPFGSKYNTRHYQGPKWSPGGRSNMQDNETHVMIESLLAALLLSTVSERGFVAAEAVGREDAFKGTVVNGLLERSYRVESNYRHVYVTYKDMLLFGTSVLWPFWDYREGTRPVRQVQRDLFGNEFFTEKVQPYIWKDDVNFNPLDVWDFFYDPNADRIENMLYGARRFRMPKFQALQFTEGVNPRWDRQAVLEALSGGPVSRRAEDSDEFESDLFRDSIDRPDWHEIDESYHPVVGFEMYALVPYRHRDGARHRRLTLLNGKLVDSRPAPSGVSRVVPAYEFIVNPIKGRFRGISPAHVTRYSQDFATGLMMVIADAVVKKAGSPVAYNAQGRPDLESLRAWKGPIRVNGDPSMVKELDYNPPLAEAMNFFQYMKLEMEEVSAANKSLQGQPLGTKRFSASEAQLTFRSQMNRPNMMASLLEREYLPAHAKGILEMNQRWLTSSAELARKVGASVAGPRLPMFEDIQGDFDIHFIGSEQIKSKEVQMQFLERGMQIYASVPGAAPIFPWAPALVKWLELADMRELETMVANKTGVEDFIMMALAQQLSRGGGGRTSGSGGFANSSMPKLAPPALLAEQVAGRALPSPTAGGEI